MVNEPFQDIDQSALNNTILMIIDNLLQRKDFMYYHVDTVHGIHYAEVITAEAAMKAAHKMNDAQRLQSLIKRYAIDVCSDQNEKKVVNTRNHVDVNVYGIVPLEIYTHTGEQKYLQEGLSYADAQWETPLSDGMTSQSRYWIDDMFMIGALQLKAYTLTGNLVYLERTALTVNNYLKKLQKDNGLFHHGHEAPFFWGRGNGWCAAAMAQLLKILPETNEHYISTNNGYKKMMHTLLQLQSDKGMWNQLLDYKDAWSESSCTAMFAYAFTEGIKTGILSEKEYRPAVKKSLDALLQKLDGNGNLADICAGTGQSAQSAYYLERPRIKGDLHGQAFLLTFLYCILQDDI